ncbi:VOC family protein [Umezawaea beigongshangensis]|uniref:VOC family protein n=1 Tax=Umezawaea beigongshangensis TaxID=2780383 RepID=UPI0018F1D9C8|nr:VOC family protein [Umezawaea beigongshangensis]
MDVETGGALRGTEAQDAVGDAGWRLVLGALCACVGVGSLVQAAEVAARVVADAGDDADEHLRVDLRRDGVVLTVRTFAAGAVTARDVALALSASAVVADLGLRTESGAALQAPEIAVDASDIGAVRPFWRAVTGYADESAHPHAGLIDPLGRGPAVWFQQMTGTRPQRNRVHLDLSVPHDEAPSRVRAALAAGGVLRSDAHAPAFWVLADAEGNEVCVSTWQGRDG